MDKYVTTWPIMHPHITIESIIQTVCKTYMKQFPNKYFKHVYIDDKISLNNMYLDDEIITKKRIPFLLMNYETDFDTKNTTGAFDFPYLYAPHYIAGNLKDLYLRIFYDPISDIYIYVPFSRIKITINVTLGVSSRREQTDLYYWLLNNFRYEGPPTSLVDFPVFTPIPQSFIEYIGLIKGYNLKDDEQVKSFYSAIYKNSSGIIRNRKLITDKSINTFFLDYVMKECKLWNKEKPQLQEGTMKNMVTTDFRITHPIEIEPNIPLSLILVTPEVINGKKVPKNYKYSILDNKNLDSRIYKNIIKTTYFSYFKTRNWDIAINEDFILDRNGLNEILLEDILPVEYMDLYKKVLNKKSYIGIKDYFSIELYRHNKIMAEGNEYLIDNNNLKINILNGDIKNVYKLMIFTNPITCDHIFKSMKIAKTEDEIYQIMDDIAAGNI